MLGYLRELQRQHSLAVVLVHHASKNHRAHPGQSLRGSSDLHAFGDSNAYLAHRSDQQLVLTLEHRAAPAPEPMTLKLAASSDGARVHLAITGSPTADAPAPSLEHAVLDLLAKLEEPQPRTALRAMLRVNNNRLGDVLVDLERRNKIMRTPQGWLLTPPSDTTQRSLFS